MVRKSGKKILSLLLALSMVMGMMPMGALAAVDETFTVDNLVYKVLSEAEGNKTVELMGYTERNEPTGEFVVPEFVNHNSTTYTAISIGEGAFSWCKNITKVTLSNSIISVGKEAFKYCIFATVDLGNSLENIGESAFDSSELTSVHIPASVKTIGEDAFSQCVSLTGFTVDGYNVNFSAADGILYNKNKTELILYPIGKTETSFSIPGTVETIGKNAFEFNKKLESITIGSSVVTIEDSALSYCEKLSKVTIGENVETLGDLAFSYCYSLDNITFEGSSKLKEIGKEAFRASNIVSLSLPNSLETIGEGAFIYCNNLESITIGPNVSSIGKNAFSIAAKLSTLTIDENNPYYKAENGVLYNKTIDTLIKYLPAKSDTSFVVPSTVNRIEESAFNGCGNLVDVTISASVNSIGESAFNWANKMKSISFLGATPPTLGDDIFASCGSLSSINVPIGAKSAYVTALVECDLTDYESKIKEIEPPGSITGSMDIGGVRGVDLTKNGAGTGWVWNATSATLILTPEYTGSEITIMCDNNTDIINLEYIGDVTINNRISCYGNLNISGSGGKLKINEDGTRSASAISVNGSLNIKGGNIEAICAYERASVIYAEKIIIVSGTANVSVNATSTKKATSHGLHSNSDSITIKDNSKVTVELVNGKGISARDVFIEGAADVSSKVTDSGYAIYAIGNNIEIKGGNIRAESAGVNSVAIYAYNRVKISGGTVEAKSGGEASGVIQGAIYISGGTFTATPTADNGKGIFSYSTINIEGDTTKINATGKGTGYALYSTTIVRINGGDINLNSVEKNFIKEVLILKGGSIKFNDAPADLINITAQPQSVTVVNGNMSEKLSVSANTTGTAISYEWFKDTRERGIDYFFVEKIEGATSSEFTIPTNLAVGDHYYFCKISAEGKVPVYTDIATVTVKSGGTPDPNPDPNPDPDPTPVPAPTQPTTPTQPPVWQNPFSDIKEDAWFYNAVKFVQEKGLMSGVAEDNFAPNKEATRAMIVTILHRLAGTPKVTGDNPFADVNAGEYYGDPVIWAAKNNIISGYGDGKFAPGDSITREQLAVILMNYATLMGFDVSNRTSTSNFTDRADISYWATEAMSWANAISIINGKGNNVLDPKGKATRAEIAAMLQRFIESYKID